MLLRMGGPLLMAMALTGTLAACGQEKGVSAENESVESVAKKVAEAGEQIRPRAGRWRNEMKLEKLEIPGMPAQLKEAMSKQLSTAQTHFSCLTPEEAERPNATFFQKEASGCTYKRFTMAGGKVDAEMVCDRGQGQQQSMTMSGTYSDERFDMRMSSQGSMGRGMTMNMTMAIKAERVGECNGSEQS